MNAVDENMIREQLAEAVAIIDPVGPPLAQLTAKATRRRRNFRLAGGFGVAALAGACALVAVLVIPSGNTAKITTPAAPTARSLTDFAAANGAIKTNSKTTVIAGPFEGRDGFYGAFAVKKGLDLAAWDGSAWRIDGQTRTKFGPGEFVEKVTDGPAINGPSLYVRGEGGDVSYFGYVLEHSTTGWAPVKFGKYDSVAYGRPGGPGFISVRNNCRPNCAAGTQSKKFWRWNSAKDKFVLVRSHTL